MSLTRFKRLKINKMDNFKLKALQNMVKAYDVIELKEHPSHHGNDFACVLKFKFKEEEFYKFIYYNYNNSAFLKQSINDCVTNGIRDAKISVKENFYKEKSEIINRTSKHFVLSLRRLIELEIETIMIFKGVEFDRWGYANKYKEADIKNRISQGMSSLEILKEIKSNYNV